MLLPYSPLSLLPSCWGLLLAVAKGKPVDMGGRPEQISFLGQRAERGMVQNRSGEEIGNIYKDELEFTSF